MGFLTGLLYRQRPDKGIEVFRFLNLIIAMEASGTAREFDPLTVSNF